MASSRKSAKNDKIDKNIHSSKRQRRAAVRRFAPNRPVVLVSEEGRLALQPSQVSADRIGWKAFGLSCLPTEWVPPFFVVDSAALKKGIGDLGLQAQISGCLTQMDLEHSIVFIRSSGTLETIEQRGRFVSETCSSEDVLSTIKRLSETLPTLNGENVHWIVQKHIRPARKGHLSNERRLSREPRDFVAEFELQGDHPGYTTPVAVRHWRDGSAVTNFNLSCTSEAGVTLKLKKVALWATALPSRMLFEWVWSGTRLWIVQGDAARSTRGVNPGTLRPTSIAKISPSHLRVFRTAKAADYRRYGKLRNAQTYRKLGYDTPAFYVLDDAVAIQQIRSGNVPHEVEEDLEELTQRPLIIRTDGIGIPKDRREMLPRSEGLRTTADAKSWLIEQFAKETERIGIADSPLCLIAHHFIPSVSAAWARAEPGNDIVRIESLWGLPEGLYWHSHDTFEVDATGVRPLRKRLRFKGTFIAPDGQGRWIHYQTVAPFDWGRSITQTEWLTEIARTTRRVSDHEKHPVTVMWFIDNDRRATPHRVLPWYHTESEIGAPKAAPRRKLTMASDFKIETTADWEELKSKVQAGTRIERVMLEPKDPNLVRNQRFARQLAEFASQHKIVIELAGAILSHAYFILQRFGAQVECIDLFGAEEEDVEYNKVVRDKIPDYIQRKGEMVEVVRLKGDALLAALRQKLVEESFEALDARSGDDLIAELADVQEVIDGICDALQVPKDQVDAEKAEKRKRRGGFKRGFLLKKTSTPHSLTKKPPDVDVPALLDATQEPSLIEQSAAIPANRPYRRPDSRTLGEDLEGLLTFETELNRIGIDKQSVVFQMPAGEGETRSLRVSIDLTRIRSSLRSQIRVRLEPSQMAMKLGADSQLELSFKEESDPNAETDSKDMPE